MKAFLGLLAFTCLIALIYFLILDVSFLSGFKVKFQEDKIKFLRRMTQMELAFRCEKPSECLPEEYIYDVDENKIYVGGLEVWG